MAQRSLSCKAQLTSEVTVHFLIMYMVVVYNFHSVLTFGGSCCGMRAKVDYTVILIVYRLEYGNIHCEIRLYGDGGPDKRR